MMLHIPSVLTKPEVERVRALIDASEWVDGNITSGPQAALAKSNLQVRETDPGALEASALLLAALEQQPLFVSGALPRRILPPLFNRYEPGHVFRAHIDNAVRRGRVEAPMRTDLSATLFLSEPETYDGGELTVEDSYGSHSVKLPAGDLILYPASSLHQVMPIARGARVASFFWIQSMIRDDGQRALLFELDVAVQRLAQDVGLEHPSLLSLTGTYHNLLRMWADL